MVDRILRIDSLVVRARGVPVQRARELVSGLGEAVLRQLAGTPTFLSHAAGRTRVERIDAGNAPLSARQELANRVATAVIDRLETGD